MKLIEKTKYLLPIVFLCLFFLPIRAEAAVTLTWSTNTYTPAGYLGKAMPVLNSQVEVAAILDNLNIDLQKVIYVWTFSRNYYLQEKITEKGKQTFSFNIGNNLDDIYLIELEVQDGEGNIIEEAPSLAIKPIQPQVVLRSTQITNGLEQKLSSSEIDSERYSVSSNQSLKFTAIPYFFNIQRIEELDYSWNFGGEEASLADNLDDPNIFRLKIGEVGEAVIRDLQVDVSSDYYQRITTKAQLILSP